VLEYKAKCRRQIFISRGNRGKRAFHDFILNHRVRVCV
jgi:hypothetical protein